MNCVEFEKVCPKSLPSKLQWHKSVRLSILSGLLFVSDWNNPKIFTPFAQVNDICYAKSGTLYCDIFYCMCMCMCNVYVFLPSTVVTAGVVSSVVTVGSTTGVVASVVTAGPGAGVVASVVTARFVTSVVTAGEVSSVVTAGVVTSVVTAGVVTSVVTAGSVVEKTPEKYKENIIKNI